MARSNFHQLWDAANRLVTLQIFDVSIIIIHMRVNYKPSTCLGNWSLRLIVFSLLCAIVFYSLVASGERGGDTFFSNLALAITMLIVAILAVSSFFTGIIGIIRNRERAIFVYISTVIGFFVLLYGLAEIIFPH